MLTFGYRHVEPEAALVQVAVRGDTCPAVPQGAAAALPGVVVGASHRHRAGAEVGAALQLHVHVRGAAHGLDAAQQHQPVALTGERQRVAALDDRTAADPPVAPDQRPGLVVPAPGVAALARGDGVATCAAEQCGEDGVVVPSGSAHECDVAAWPDDRAALSVGEQRVLAQRLRNELRPVAG